MTWGRNAGDFPWKILPRRGSLPHRSLNQKFIARLSRLSKVVESTQTIREFHARQHLAFAKISMFQDRANAEGNVFRSVLCSSPENVISQSFSSLCVWGMCCCPSVFYSVSLATAKLGVYSHPVRTRVDLNTHQRRCYLHVEHGTGWKRTEQFWKQNVLWYVLFSVLSNLWF